ncbi:MAG: DUF2782 domain-containing protein [Thiohalobacterales bacterium]|nr:DUF2782 domain-containing protein [Thiohalobacterales bacterium]
MRILFILLTVMSVNALAEAPPTVQQAPEPPVTVVPSTGVDPDEELEPEVTIIQRDDAEVKEYRINGQLYMVKVVPVVGPAYYLFDSNGDGTLDIRRNELDPGLVVPRWMIFRW